MPKAHRSHGLLFSAFCCLLVGCQESRQPTPAPPPTPPHPLVGTWNLLARSANPVPAEELKAITNTHGWMEFKSDNTFTSVFAFGPEELRRGGTYKEIYNSLTLKSGTNGVETHSIKITDDQLLLVTPQESNTVVHTYLRRNSP